MADRLEHALENLRDIWDDEIGICEEERVDRQNVVLHHIRNLLAEERDLRSRLMDSVATYRQEVVTISQELGLEPFQVQYCRSLVKGVHGSW